MMAFAIHLPAEPGGFTVVADAITAQLAAFQPLQQRFSRRATRK